VCLNFTTSSATTSTQPVPPVSSRMVLTLTLTLITLSQSTLSIPSIPSLTQQKVPRTKLVKVPTSQLHPTRYPCSFLHGPLGGEGPVLPCRSLDANVRKQGILIITHRISTRPCSLHPITKFAACSTWEIEGSGAPHRAGQRLRDG
jgi:hypothetical protein